MTEEEYIGQYNTSGTASAVTSGLSAWNPVIGALYGIGSGMGEAARGDGTSGIGQGISEIVNPSHGFLTAIESGNWKDAIPVLGAITRNKRAKKAKKKRKELEEFDYKDTDAYRLAEQQSNLAYRQMQEGLPEASMRFQQDKIGSSGAAALNRVGDLRQGVNSTVGATTSISDSYRKLSSLDAQQRIANRGQYYKSLQNLQEQTVLNNSFEYQKYIMDKAKLLAMQSARNQDKQNAMQLGMDSASFLGQKAGTSVAEGGLGYFGQGKDKTNSDFSSYLENYSDNSDYKYDPFAGQMY